MDLDLVHQVLCLLAILEPGAQKGMLPFCLQVVDPVQHPSCAQSRYEGTAWPKAAGIQSVLAGGLRWLAEPDFRQILQVMLLEWQMAGRAVLQIEGLVEHRARAQACHGSQTGPKLARSL